jgi:hypothetical protein
MMTQKGKELEILRRVVHLPDGEGGGDMLNKNSNQVSIPQDGEGAIAPKNQVQITLLQNHLLPGGALEEENLILPHLEELGDLPLRQIVPVLHLHSHPGGIDLDLLINEEWGIGHWAWVINSSPSLPHSLPFFVQYVSYQTKLRGDVK